MRTWATVQWLQRHPEAGSSWPDWPRSLYVGGTRGGGGEGRTRGSHIETLIMYKVGSMKLSSHNDPH